MRALVIIAVVVVAAHAASLKWTGYANNNQWDTPTNWYPAQVPAANDDVTIESGVVQVPGNGACNSVVMGTLFDHPANLTIFGQFFVGNGGLNVAGNGNLIINSGDASVIASGPVSVGGLLSFMSGTISGKWTGVGKVDLGGAAQKVLSGCNFQMKGNSVLSGVILMKESSVMKLMGPVTASGDLTMQQDSSAVLIDTTTTSITYAGGQWIMQATMKLGDLTLVSGNLTLLVETTFSKTLSIPQGSFVSGLGPASVVFTGGVSGGGTVVAQGNSTTFGPIQKFDGSINACAGLCSLSTANVAGLLLCGGVLSLTNTVVAASCTLQSGSLKGSGLLQAAKGYVATRGVNIEGQITFTSAVNFQTSQLIFEKSGKLIVAVGAQANQQGTLQLTGAQGAEGIVNRGTFTTNGDVVISNVGFTGDGTLNVHSSFALTSSSLSQGNVTLSHGSTFKGSNLNIGGIAEVMSVGGTLSAHIDLYNFECPDRCSHISSSGATFVEFGFIVA